MEMKIIDEQLRDRQQIVTYKYLTEKLDIHPNKAKQLLKDYVSKLADDDKYSFTIIIGGTLQENNEFCIVLAYNDHIETVRRRFKQISFEHFYSIQPIKRFDDINNALYLVDSSLNNQANLVSSIKKKEKDNTSIGKQSTVVTKVTDKPVTEKIEPKTAEVLIKSNDSKLDAVKKKETGLDIFSKNKKINNTKPVKEKEVKEVKVSPKKTNSDFFMKFKQSGKVVNNNVNSKDEVLVEKTTKEEEKRSDIASPKKEDEKRDSESPKNNENNLGIESPKTEQKGQVNKCKTTKTAIKSNKKKENGKKNNSNKKSKRKRIQTFDSSEDEVDSEEEDKKRSELVMDVDDEVDFVQPTPPRPTPRENRKKEKQTTTSTFIDDDGFVCTSKEVQMVEIECEPPAESVDNIENSVSKEPLVKKPKMNEPIQAEKKKGKNKQSKNVSSQGMKQSSLTSFFKTK